jgi:benzoylformate decarboxylase
MAHQQNQIKWSERDRNGAQAIAEQLRVAGLIGASDSLVIGNPGSGEEWLYLELSKEIHMALAEAAVGSIVDGASRLHSKPAVAIAHGFVGFSGLQGDVFNAAQRQSPMLVIVGTADSHAHTGETHMYADVEGAAKASRAKYIKNATDPATLLRDLRDAIVQALIPPFGPVVFVVGSNVAAASNTELVIMPRLPNSQLAPPLSEIEELADQLLGSERPSILIGDGVARSGAYKELQQVAELLGADVWASMESEINFPRNHPLFRGNLGHMDDSQGRALLKDVDYALAIGTPIYQTVFNSKEPLFQPNVPIAAINQDPETTLRGHNDVTLPIKGDPKRILGMLTDSIERKRTVEQAAKAEEYLESERQRKEAILKRRRESQLAEPGVTIAKFADLLERRMKKILDRPVIFNEALVGGVGLTDYIENINIPGKYFDTSGGSLGEWAGAVGAAMIGRPTLAFIGDGGFHYAPQSLWNAARHNLPLGMVVVNNSEYGLLIANMNAALQGRGIERSSIPETHFLQLADIDYVKIAEGYGVPGVRVDDEALIEEAVDRLMAFDGPFLVDLIVKIVFQ